MGVQFQQPPGYQQIRAGEVWALYRDHYPHVAEQAALQPVFETFGLPQGAQLDFGILSGASHDRFWFLSPDKDELIQFQNDRLLHNWRRVGVQTNDYPHFEAIICKFQDELTKLERYMASLGGSSDQPLKINQAEITYINHIPCEGGPGTACAPGSWLSLLDADEHGFEDFNCTFRKRVIGADGSPYARLICQAAIGVAAGNRVIILNLTVRGAPRGENIQAAVDFLGMGRQMIVEFFTQITTEQAHAVWGRFQ
jgi:uncharacterized protein (TIGR04255 family)